MFKKLLRSRRRSRRRRTRGDSADVPLVRFLGPLFTVAGSMTVLGMVLMGQIDLTSLDQFTAASEDGSPAMTLKPVRLDSIRQKSGATIRVATLMVDAFSGTDNVRPDQISMLARIVTQFDVVAIQGIHGTQAASIRSLIDLIRASGSSFTATIGNPVGRGDDTIRYAFVWDDARMSLVPGSVGMVGDTSDRMLYEPMYASFETRVGPADGHLPFQFTLINACAADSTSIGRAEMNVLDDVFVSVRNYGYEMTGEEDCILLGNLKSEANQLGELAEIPGVTSVGQSTDQSARQRQHILMDRSHTAEFAGASGAMDLTKQLGISKSEMQTITNQGPVWADFSIHEVPTQNAAPAQWRIVR